MKITRRKSVKANINTKRKYVSASVGDAVDATEIREILENAGFGYVHVKKVSTHLGTEYEIEMNGASGSDMMQAIRDAGFSVEFDTTANGCMYVSITDGRKDPAFLYRVSYDYTSDIVEMDDETGDYQKVVDKLIDTLESEGKMGYLMTINEAEAEGYYEDQYTIGGNHDLALIHNGNFNIEPLGWSNEVSVQSSTSTKRKYTVKASVYDEDTGFSESDNLIYEREQFVTNLIHELEAEYRIKVSNDAWGQIMDLARDLGFGADAKSHGSTPQYILEDAIYDIVEKDTGIVIGSTDITADSDLRDRFVNPEDFVFFFNGKEMYRGTGDGFSNVIAGLCKDESTNRKFQEWCNQFGDPFDFDGTPKDTAYVFTWLVEQERMEMDDFYLDGSGILNFEIYNASDMAQVQSSTNIRASIDDLVCL